MSGKNAVLQHDALFIEDSENKYSKPGVKLALNFIAVLLLGVNFDKINSTYFSSVAIFALPMLYEYLRISSENRIKRILKRVEMAILLITVMICVLGFVGILVIVPFGTVPHIMVQKDYVIGGGLHFPAYGFWGIVFVSFFISAIDFFATKTTADLDQNNTQEGTHSSKQALK